MIWLSQKLGEQWWGFLFALTATGAGLDQGKDKGGDGGVGGADFYDDAGDGDDADEGGFHDDGLDLFSRQGQGRRALLGRSSAQSALSGLIVTRGQIFTGLDWIF